MVRDGRKKLGMKKGVGVGGGGMAGAERTGKHKQAQVLGNYTHLQ